MTRDETIRIVKGHEARLRAAGMSALYLFGSTARGETHSRSDIDLSCDLNDQQPISLLDFLRMQDELESILGSKVDLVERQCIIPTIRAHAEQDMVQIF